MHFIMRNFFFILLITFTINNLFSQEEQCGLVNYNSGMAQDYGIPSNFEGGSAVVKVYFLVYADNNGNGGVDANRVALVFARLNNYYAGTGISFYYSPCETQFIRSTSLHQSTDICDFVDPNRHTDGIDIHVKGDLTNFIGIASNIPGDEYLVGGRRTDGTPAALSSTIAHEMGHCLGLFHTHHGTCPEFGDDCFGNPIIGGNATTGDFVTDTPRDPRGTNNITCDFNNDPVCAMGSFNPLTNNIMSYYTHTCRTNFTMGQIARIMMTMLPEVIYSGNTEETCSCVDLVITTNTELITNESYNSIRIMNNSVLTIKSNINVFDNVIVEVGSKLILDGGKLSNCINTQSWKGIKAWGNPFWGQTYAVELKNGAVIENAEIGINTSNIVAGGMFGSAFDLSGAKVTVDNSTIKNCGTGVNFGPFGYSGTWFSWEDDSHFINSTFENCEIGVKLTSNLGVDFQNVNFIGNNTYTGIESVNSKISVSDCDFEGANGINFSATWPNLVGSEISNNNFLNEYEGLLWDAQGNATEHSIIGNLFGSSTGVLGFGQSFFNIQSNDFTGGSGVFTWYSGDDYNLVTDNGFNGNDYGVSAWGRNNVEFLTNCFDNIVTVNIEMYDNASIFDLQGDSDLAASNCFTKQVPTFLTGAGSDYFTYFVKTGTIPQSCRHPGFAGNFGLDYSPDEVSLLTCGTGVWGSLPPRYRNCVIPATLQERKQMELALKAEIERLKNDPNISPLLKKWLIARYERCLKKLIGLIALEIVKTTGDGREQAITYLSNQALFSHKIMAYGLIAESGDYSRAASYLNAIPTVSSGESEFVQSQNLFLNYITQGENFVLTNQQKTSLKAIAKSENEWSGFARTIYYVLTGEKIKIDLPHLIPANPRSRVETNAENSIVIQSYPNPVSNGEQHIVNIQAENGNTQYQISLFDMMGKEVISKKAKNGENALDLNTFNKGIFILEVTTDGKQIYSNKLIKL